MRQTLQAVRGMNDILPADSPAWQALERALRQFANQYGYQEIRLPIVEMTELFCRSIGEVTDIVEKEMYVFQDRNGDSLALRPEGTAGCVRAGIEHGLLYNQQQKLWYLGPMFRHERPQKGRYRQFYHFGLEAFGMASPSVDVELIALAWRLWQQLGVSHVVRLQLNSLGTQEERFIYREKLVSFYEANKHLLDEDSLRRLSGNPLRILDSKNPALIELNQQAPSLMQCLGQASRDHIALVCEQLDALAIPYKLNERLVRGLDYYTHTVFEWVTDELGAQGTICAGGRYDGLVAQLGGKATPAVGMAFGLERILALWQQHGVAAKPGPETLFIASKTPEADLKMMRYVESWRAICPDFCFWVDAEHASLSTLLKRADKRGASYALIVGDEAEILLKPLRGQGEQQALLPEAVSLWLNEWVSS